MRWTMLLLILGMAAATYVPRMLPLVLLRADRIPPKVRAVLQNVPYAALGALIVPGVFTFHAQGPLFGAIGGLTAVAAAYMGANLITVVVAAVAALTLYSWLI